MFFLQVLGHTRCHENARVQSYFLINTVGVQDIPNLDNVVEQLSHDVWTCQINFQDFLWPLYLFEVVIKVALQIEIEWLIIFCHDKHVEEFVKDGSGKFVLVRMTSLFALEKMFTCGSNIGLSYLSKSNPFCFLDLCISIKDVFIHGLRVFRIILSAVTLSACISS